MIEKERTRCGHCKYFQIDGMFGLWCDKGLNWGEVTYCKYFERNRKGMTKTEMIDELDNISDENKKLKKENEQLQFKLKECHDNKLFSRRELEKENERIKHMIQEAYETERTAIGKNVLKQLMEAIE